MNKTAIKSFAIWSRKKLMDDIRVRAELIGITEEGIQKPLPQSTDGIQYFDVGTVDPHSITGSDIFNRERIVSRMQNRVHGQDYVTAYRNLLEHTASTWFNRLAAIRFMEVNDYFDDGLRVLSSTEEGKQDSDLMSNPFDSNLEFSENERQEIIGWRLNNRSEELFRKLLLKKCKKLNEILPGLFNSDDDPTELLMNFSITDKNGFVWHLTHDVDEEDWTEQVEIIGWLYQFYNTELKDDTFANLKNNIKINKETLPAVTQLFTPEWIVRYMVENSLGRIWIEGHPDSMLKSNWEYYVEEVDQEPEVEDQLRKIRVEYNGLSPEDLSFIDPCMGSGHILAYAFDVLMQIYEANGYVARDAVRSIIENNLYGLDIDERAYQLAYFSIIMKARQYDRGAFRRGYAPRVYAIEESNGISQQQIEFFGSELDEKERNSAIAQIAELLDTFKDAKEYGAILMPNEMDWDLLHRFLNSFDNYGSLEALVLNFDELQKKLRKMVSVAYILSRSYWVVCTNPPYRGVSDCDALLVEYTKEKFPKSKTDLSTIFMERNLVLCKMHGMSAMINIPVWMFLSTYEGLRKELTGSNTIINMLHFGRGIFGSDFGTTGFVLKKGMLNNYRGNYRRLFQKQGAVDSNETKEKWFKEGIGKYTSTQDRFSNIPGTPIAYWMSSEVEKDFIMGKPLCQVADIKQGIKTGDNNRFLRLWFEVDANCFSLMNGKKWFPCNKGGDYRRWYGNNDYVINWENDGQEIKNFRHSDGRQKSRPQNLQYQFKEGLTYTNISSSKFGIRYCPSGFIFDAAGSMIFPNKTSIYYMLALLSSNTVLAFTRILSPTMSFEVGQISQIPYISVECEMVEKLAKESVEMARQEYDSFETSWDFRGHPMIHREKQVNEDELIAEYYNSHSETFILEENAITRCRMSINDENGTNDMIQRVLKAAHNDKSSFPDWKGDDIIVENYAVSSSKPIRKNGKHKGSEEYPRRKEYRKELYAEIKDFLRDDSVDEGKQIGKEYHAPEHSYDHFVSSFKHSWSSHVNSLDGYVEDSKYKVMMIYYPEHALRQEYDSDNDIYKLHNDVNLLSYIFDSRGRYTHVIFIGDGRPEIIAIDDIPELIEKCPSDVRPICINGNTLTVTRKTTNPFYKKQYTIETAYSLWEEECDARFNELKANEEELNRIFIDIYGLQGELTPDVADEDVTVRRADLKRDIKSFISYAVGCMLGRYSLDIEGLAYAGGDWDSRKYSTFIPDDDNCIPITDEDYFQDDIVGRFVEFVKTVYGEETLEDNLKFIADAIGGNGEPRDVIRKYFLNDFFKDHCQTYSVTGSGKRPIYWLFDSGKQNGFKALVYMHRWNSDTIATVRAKYVTKVQEKYENELRAIDLQFEHLTDPRQKASLQKRKEHIEKQVVEIKDYDEIISHIALDHIDIDLDDGVKVNHEKVQHDRSGEKYNILAPIK